MFNYVLNSLHHRKSIYANHYYPFQTVLTINYEFIFDKYLQSLQFINLNNYFLSPSIHFS